MTTTTTTPARAATKRKSRTPVPAPEVTPASVDVISAPTAVVVQVPVDLLDDHPLNPRRDVGDLAELADSIRVHGIRQNLLITPNHGVVDRYWLVIGHRRAAAARLCGIEMVPAVIDDTLTEAAALELMLLENLQRTDLTPVEEADGYQGLLDLGLDVTGIAKRTGRSRSTVESRLALLGLPEDARELVHTYQATLGDAMRLAELAARPDVPAGSGVLADLTEHLGQYGFVHYAQRVEEGLERDARRTAVTAELTAAGVKIIDRDPYGGDPKGAKPLEQLTDSTKGNPYSAPNLTPAKHASCPGHVAWLNTYTAEATYGCQDWKKNDHRDRYASTRSSTGRDDGDTVDRRTLVANNKAAIAAQTVRRDWIRTELLTRTKMPTDAPTYIARLVRPGNTPPFDERTMFDSLVYAGKSPTDHDRHADQMITGRATALLVALAAARIECQMPKDFWRATGYRREEQAFHLTRLAAWGYELSDVERLLVDAQADQEVAS
jgi:ParB/RepB/Spo0J family partition protein